MYIERILENLKSSKKVERFLKWHKMSYSEEYRQFLKAESFLNIVGEIKRGGNLVKYEGRDLSDCAERGLRSYFYLNRTHFLERVIKGPPDAFRWKAWLIVSRVPEVRSLSLYTCLLEVELDSETEIQINKDITRTLRDSNLDNSEIQNKLYKLLRAFAILDRDLSYCQGMNFIVGFFLIVSDFNELETFYMLIAVFSNTFSKTHTPIRDFFSKGFPMLMFYLHVFDHFFKIKLPKLYMHFTNLEVPNQCWIGKWFQTLFTHCLTFDALMRLWDHILSVGLEFMISFSFSLLSFLENQLMTLTDLVEVTDFFKRLNTFHYKLDPDTQIDYNIEDLLMKARKKFMISKDEIRDLRFEFYTIKEHIDFLIDEKEKIPYEMSDVIYNLGEYNYKKLGRIDISPDKLRKNNTSNTSNSHNTNNTSNVNTRNNTHNNLMIDKIYDKICDNMKMNMNINININLNIDNPNPDNSRSSSSSSGEDFDDEGVFTEVGILEENKKALEAMNANNFHFSNPFLKRANCINETSIKGGEAKDSFLENAKKDF